MQKMKTKFAIFAGCQKTIKVEEKLVERAKFLLNLKMSLNWKLFETNERRK